MMNDIRYFWTVHRSDFLLFLAAFILARIIYYSYILLVDIRRKN